MTTGKTVGMKPGRVITHGAYDELSSPLSPTSQGGKSNENLSIHKTHRHLHIVGADLRAPCAGYAGGGSTFGRGPHLLL